MEKQGLNIWALGIDEDVTRPETKMIGGENWPIMKSENESVKEFIKRILEARRDDLKDWYRNDADGIQGGYDGDVGSVSFYIGFVETSVAANKTQTSNGANSSQNTSTTSTTHFNAGDTVNTKAEAEAYVEYLENRLNTIGDDAQLANVDLQNWLQKQQQTLQMMSTISKQLHDTAMAIIRKMGG